MWRLKKSPKVSQITSRIYGFLKETEGLYLYRLAKSCQGKGVIVEIGSFCGKSTVWLGKGSQAGKNIKVYAIDPFDLGDSKSLLSTYGERVDTYQDFIRNIRKAHLNKIVIPIIGRSQEVLKNFNRKIELAFVDGAHQYQFVKEDFLLVLPKMVQGGVMAFHDATNHPGVKKLMIELSRMLNVVRKFERVGSIISWRKLSGDKA